MKLLVRADASTTIGTGHVMRCLALGQAWQDAGGQVTFLTTSEAPALLGRLEGEGMDVALLAAPPGSAQDATESLDLSHQLGAEWIVVDGYHFGAEYQRQLKESGLGILFIDDEGRGDHYYADLVLNQNIHAHEGLYEAREPHTRLLLGPRYALLRREFWPWRGWRREVPEAARKILVTLGGGDPDNVTGKVVQALGQLKPAGLEVVVIVGGANPHFQQLGKALGSLPFPARLERNVANMPELMAWADMAITGGGSTCWETAFMGLPNLTICLADNQRPVAEGLGKSGLSIGLGWHGDVSPEYIAREVARLQDNGALRAEMCRQGRLLVDGKGGARAVRSMRGGPIKLRPAHASDCRMMWEWSNDPYVRSISFSSDPIPWEKHVEWFHARIEDPNCFYYVALQAADEQPIGQLRFQIDGNEADINISIVEKYRSKGYGAEIIYSGCRELFDLTAVKIIHAYVKESNNASIRVFEKAGFKNLGLVVKNNHRTFHFILAENQLS